MNCVLWGIFICLMGSALGGANGQVAEGVPCETPDEEYGICINIYNCSRLMNLLITQSNNPRVRTFLRSSTCGYEGSTPMVCCPEPDNVNENPTFSSGSKYTVTEKTSTASSLPVKPNCGYSNFTIRKIVKGLPARRGEFPWIAALGYKNSKNPDLPKWLCGGSLITDRHILTAAHCVYNRNDLFAARLGDLDLFSADDGADPETIPLIKAKIHKEYSPVNFTSDIAILTLAHSPRKTRFWPICLSIDPQLRPRNLVAEPTVAGWGLMYVNGSTSPTLEEVTMPVVDNERCQNAYGTKAIIDDKVLCAGYKNGGKDACQGDSGGHLMLRLADREAETWTYQIGIVSYGTRCEVKNPRIYTKVTAFLDWIGKNIN